MSATVQITEAHSTSDIQSPDALRSLRTRTWRPRYASSTDDLIADFYAPAFDTATCFDRAVGYFRSSLFGLLSDSVAYFAIEGGHIRLLCAPELTAEDAEAIARGTDMNKVVDRALLRELETILADPRASTPVEMLSSLVAIGALEIRFAVPEAAGGLFHTKVGIFTDARGDALSFSGSINDTWSAWHPLGNHESFEVFMEWSADAQRVRDHRDYFATLWAGDIDGFTVLSAPSAFREKLVTIAGSEPRDRLVKMVDDGSAAVRPRKLLNYQRAALTDWREHGRRGLLMHATGAGKTVTALHAARQWISKNEPVLVLVPGVELLDQWNAEARRELADLAPSILLAGAGHHRWRRGALLASHLSSGQNAGLVIATMQTAASDQFRAALADAENHLLLIADEVHRLGSPRNRSLMTINAAARLGLSATPHRANDPVGTGEIIRYFERVIEPVITLGDAIRAERLCQYEYFPHFVSLSGDEQDSWVRETRRLRRALASTQDFGEMPESIKLLLIRRARISKSAAAKVPLAIDIVKQNYEPNQSWLLYCDDITQVRQVLAGLQAAGIPAYEYHSNMRGDRGATLDAFKNRGGVIVSVRCLDEGVDIPTVSHALILASSQSTREHIQRRGRVLRTAPGKYFAVVHDLLVLPDHADRDFDALTRAELRRALKFSQDAMNSAAGIRLQEIATELGIDVDDLGTPDTAALFREDEDADD